VQASAATRLWNRQSIVQQTSLKPKKVKQHQTTMIDRITVLLLQLFLQLSAAEEQQQQQQKKNISLPFQACPTHQIIVQHSQVQKRSNLHSASDAAFLLQWSCGHLGPCPALNGWRSWDGNDDGAGSKRKSLLYYSFASHIFSHQSSPIEPQFRASLIHNRITLKSLAGSRPLI